jgi:hypothetical protein
MLASIALGLLLISACEINGLGEFLSFVVWNWPFLVLGALILPGLRRLLWTSALDPTFLFDISEKLALDWFASQLAVLVIVVVVVTGVVFACVVFAWAISADIISDG